MSQKRHRGQWLVGGEAGFGIMSTGALVAKVAVRCGLHVFDDAEYPSLIRGGHNAMRVTLGSEPIAAQTTSLDILLALNRETIEKHLVHVATDGVVLFDSSDLTFGNFTAPEDSRTWIGLPLEDIARKAGGQKLMRNTVAAGASVALLGLPVAEAEVLLRQEFSAKGDEVVALNIALVHSGFDAVTSAHRSASPISLALPKKPLSRLYLTGNEALSLGALQAGCTFYAAYPMTPATSLLTFLVEHGPTYGMVVRHAEDEIAVVNMTIGAAYAGLRAMCGTSGGGFALMTEAVGMAAMTEVGLVMVNAQRGGPSTGLPTWTEQADLRQVIHASQGDSFRIVLAPSSISDCYRMIQEAFHYADKYHTPVIVLTDKLLAESHQSLDALPKNIPIIRDVLASPDPSTTLFPRYEPTAKDGVSPRTIPGIPGGQFLANSDEHDAYGHTNEDQENRLAQMDKRLAKELYYQQQIPEQVVLGPKKADVAIVTWGSSRGAVEEAMEMLREQGMTATTLVITHLWPLPAEDIQRFLRPHRKRIIVEGNQSGQLESLIRQVTGDVFDIPIRRYDGRPFEPRDIAQTIIKHLT